MSELPAVEPIRLGPRGSLRSRRSSEFEALFRSEYAGMVRLAFAVLANRAEAEEVVQDAFVDVHRRWNEILNPPAYLRAAVVHGARAVMRRRIKRDELHTLAGPRLVTTHEDHDYIIDVLALLPERQQIAVVLAYYAELSPGEIAEVLECRTGTAKSLVHRGLKRIRTELQR
jgi:RNA polymerase sigma factor (sigma-70 family)